MYSTVRCTPDLRLTPEQKLLKPPINAVVSPRVQPARIPYKCPSSIRAARAIASNISPVCPFQGNRLPLPDFLLRPVHPILEPHPSCSIQQSTLPGFSLTLGLPDLVSSLNHFRDNVKLVAHHPNVSKIIPGAPDVGYPHVDGYKLDRLRLLVCAAAIPPQKLPKPRRTFRT